MAWPKRGTRKIVVDGELFVWHGLGKCLCCAHIITAGKPGAPHVLFIDPFVWSMDIRPRGIAEAIRWARSEGWSAESGPTRGLALDEASQRFRWLAENQRHVACEASSSTAAPGSTT